MNKKNLVILIIFGLFLIVCVLFWRFSKIGFLEKNIVQYDWDNETKIFEISVPDNFDEYRRERLTEKINDARTLYETKKDETWTWITIGNMYEFARDYDRAIGAYEKAVSLNEMEYISRMNLAYIYENQKNNYTKAEEYYKKVIELNATNPTHYINLARFYEFKEEKMNEVEAVYLDGLIKTGDNPDVMVALIRFYERRGNKDKISEYSEKLINLNPDNSAYKNDFGSFIK